MQGGSLRVGHYPLLVIILYWKHPTDSDPDGFNGTVDAQDEDKFAVFDLVKY
jgi:hypothetical protein